MQIDFSAAFDRVNHQGIIYKLSSVGIGGSVLSVLTQFLSIQSQYVLVDGCRRKLVNVVSGVLQVCVLLFLLYTSELFSILENKLIGYADDSTLMAVVTSPGSRVTEAESMAVTPINHCLLLLYISIYIYTLLEIVFRILNYILSISSVK